MANTTDKENDLKNDTYPTALFLSTVLLSGLFLPLFLLLLAWLAELSESVNIRFPAIIILAMPLLIGYLIHLRTTKLQLGTTYIWYFTCRATFFLLLIWWMPIAIDIFVYNGDNDKYLALAFTWHIILLITFFFWFKQYRIRKHKPEEITPGCLQ